ncbi:MAG: hypothetical protein ABJE47_23495 [bacterium]
MRALTGWFHAIATGDTAAIRMHVSPHFGVFSAGSNGKPEPFFRAETIIELQAYVLRRARAHEQLQWHSVQFNGWHGTMLWFGPIFYTRRADDVAGGAHEWIGKGVYDCQKGLHILNTAPM